MCGSSSIKRERDVFFSLLKRILKISAYEKIVRADVKLEVSNSLKIYDGNTDQSHAAQFQLIMLPCIKKNEPAPPLLCVMMHREKLFCSSVRRRVIFVFHLHPYWSYFRL